jgi:hypothetical protein
MKKAFRLAWGLLLLLPVFSFSPIEPSKKADNIYYAFAYDAVSQGNNVYAATIYFLKVNATNFTYTYVNAPQNIEITGNFPSSVTSFTFPAGANSLYVGTFTFSSPPTQAYAISTDPTSIGGLSISDELTDINIP